MEHDGDNVILNDLNDLTYGWKAEVYVDEDGHLNFFVENKDCDKLIEVDVDGDNNGWMRFRLTTEKIEAAYADSLS